ncbi:head GIN domain-containing protein [Hymenobacter volaticus]|uniref:DUF2807 domain-containing protein n=1 Tax=Hymenobacter volaticus TaxID=2932254 RepID=A0ABY4GCU3_9BACT|nr:head GIN domain-containing protein [Hymenobacter volaticus]UOQ68712.1 DUF2807 domain-containing protein [Hymenobacter volaticus]
MKTNWLLFPLLAVLALTSCDNEHNIIGPRVRGTGPTESEIRTLDNFNRVDLKMDAEVILTQGSPQQVRVEAQRNVLDVLETELNGDELQLEFGRVNVRDHDPIKIYITVPNLTEVQLSGSGKIRSSTPWSASTCEVKVSGSGSVAMDFTQATSLRTNVSGSGEAQVKGISQSHNINISGSGQVKATDLSTQDTYVAITGSGRSYVRAERTLSAEISGSGSVYYKGSPTINTRITGSGRVLADK